MDDTSNNLLYTVLSDSLRQKSFFSSARRER